MNKFPHSNSFFQNKLQYRNPLHLNDFNNMMMSGSDYHHESVQFNPNSNLNFIGDLNENSLKSNMINLLPDKSNDIPKSINFSLNDKIKNSMTDLLPSSYTFNKFLPKSCQTNFGPLPQKVTANSFASIPFYIPFLVIILMKITNITSIN